MSNIYTQERNELTQWVEHWQKRCAEFILRLSILRLRPFAFKFNSVDDLKYLIKFLGWQHRLCYVLQSIRSFCLNSQVLFNYKQPLTDLMQTMFQAWPPHFILRHFIFRIVLYNVFYFVFSCFIRFIWILLLNKKTREKGRDVYKRLTRSHINMHKKVIGPHWHAYIHTRKDNC